MDVKFLKLTSFFRMQAYIIAAGIATVLEFLIMFSGTTLFNVSYNLLLILIHFLNLACLLYYKREAMHVDRIKYTFWFGTLPPLVLEAISSCTSKSNYRRRSA